MVYYDNKSALATLVAGKAITQRRGGRRQISRMNASARLEFGYLILPTTVLKNAGWTNPEDAAHRLRQNFEKLSQKVDHVHQVQRTKLCT
jgi:hypothetical protein